VAQRIVAAVDISSRAPLASQRASEPLRQYRLGLHSAPVRPEAEPHQPPFELRRCIFAPRRADASAPERIVPHDILLVLSPDDAAAGKGGENGVGHFCFLARDFS
jgi:hypothetical protein